MLQSLHIENVAVIEKADISFDKGLAVLTGETGAGKSIVIDALNGVLGERITRDVVRTIIASYGRIEGSDWPSIKNRIKDELHRFIYEKIKRNPMILPIIVDLG